MPNDGALAGALLLSEQLSTDRFLDRLDRNRANAQLTVDNALLRRDASRSRGATTSLSPSLTTCCGGRRRLPKTPIARTPSSPGFGRRPKSYGMET